MRETVLLYSGASTVGGVTSGVVTGSLLGAVLGATTTGVLGASGAPVVFSHPVKKMAAVTPAVSNARPFPDVFMTEAYHRLAKYSNVVEYLKNHLIMVLFTHVEKGCVHRLFCQ
jgi:hypothetical protein